MKANIWKEIISLDLMYNKEYNLLHFSDSPYTKGMPKESWGG